MENQTTNQQELNTQPNEAWKVLSPISHFWLAFIVATSGLVIRELFDSEHHAHLFKEWAIQASVVFPLSALVSSILVFLIYTKIFGNKKPTNFKIILIVLIHYLFISLLSCGYDEVYRHISKDLQVGSVLATFLTMAFIAKWEFGVYAILFIISYFPNQYNKFKVVFPPKINFRLLILPIVTMSLMAYVATNVKIRSKQFVQKEFVNELARTGKFITQADEISVSNEVKVQEKKYGLKVTGESSKQLIEKLREEPTKLTFTLGNKDADFNDLEQVCDLMHYRWGDVRKQMELSDSETLSFEIKIQPDFKSAKLQSCSVGGYRMKLVISSLDENSPSTIHLLKEGSFIFNADEQSYLEIKGLRFEGDGSSQIMQLAGNVTFKDNIVEMQKKPEWFGLNVTSSSKDASVDITNNQFTNAPVLASGKASISDNHFSGADAYIKVNGDAAPEIGTNFFDGTNINLIWAAENSHPNITGKLYLASPSKSSALYTTDNAVVNFKDGSIAAPNASGCLYADKSAKLIVDNVNIGPCGQDYWPVYLDGKATAEIRHSTFNTKREGMKNQFNKALEDAVLILEDNKVTD